MQHLSDRRWHQHDYHLPDIPYPEPDFYEQYSGKQTDHFYVSKDGGEGEEIDAISGATITSRAVTGAVNSSLGYFQNVLGGSADE